MGDPYAKGLNHGSYAAFRNPHLNGPAFLGMAV